MSKIKAPFPFFGGKSKVAPLVWEAFGRPRNYVEPFAGSAAVLLARPDWVEGTNWTETVNDSDGLLINFWRAVKSAPDAVALHAENPLSEVDIQARHASILRRKGALLASLVADPHWFDAEMAGWWVWLMSACAIPRGLFTDKASLPAKGHRMTGVCTHAIRTSLPSVLERLTARLRFVRLRCGSWERCTQSKSMMGESDRTPTAVFFDPPYAGTDAQYDTQEVALEQRVWAEALRLGALPGLRVCVAGYADGRDVPADWREVPWKAGGGYGRKAHGVGRANAHKERLWFSPGCLPLDA